MQAILKHKSSIHDRTGHIRDCFLSKGFPYLKVELEANVDPDGYIGESECFNCNGSGRIRCGTCDGSGTIQCRCTACNGSGDIEDTDGQLHTCPDCVGGYRNETCQDCSYGYVDCRECNSRGYFDSDGWIDDYLDDFWKAFKKKMGDIMDVLEYTHIYNDGSVDTEITLTLRIEYLHRLPDIVKAFRDTCHEFGNCGTDNAGLHITLLTDSMYPTLKKLDERKLANFKRQVGKLLLGLVCLGSPDDSTRAFEFRDLEISSDRKYSAIYTKGDTCIEFRLFDACFNRPDYIIRYLELINKSLHYYSDEPRRFVKLKDGVSLMRSNQILNKEYKGCYRGLAYVFHTNESITRLFRELAYFVKPKLRLWLAYASKGYSQGVLTSQELFASLVSELKE